MNGGKETEESPEKDYWRAVSQWIKATKDRYRGFRGSDLTQCFMRGPFAGWSEREVLELADRLCENATRFPLRGHEGLEWGGGGAAGREEPCTAGGAGGEGGGEAEPDYCPVCRSCGEEGCCSVEQSIISHGCKYAEHYAWQVSYDKAIIEEFHKLTEAMGLGRDETGAVVKDPIGELYDRAWKTVEDKYKKPSGGNPEE